MGIITLFFYLFGNFPNEIILNILLEVTKGKCMYFTKNSFILSGNHPRFNLNPFPPLEQWVCI